ncbi:MAG TPA: polyphosphate kinase 2 family protein [Acidobacteriaceae bacterium]|jgi:PPK2 family polyphosphate:nucleotide phosphotransferase|nr:polyphosphate kinase 2 family protein [Acidobacteriaceae bacterium]
MNYRKQFQISPGTCVRLADFDPRLTGMHQKKGAALAEIEKLRQRLGKLQYRLYSDQKRSLLICLQGPDAGGKDGVVRHVIGSMNPQGCRVVAFKQPTAEEHAHDFLWRVERQVPRRDEVVIFNRSHYEDVLVVRVHDLVPKNIWSKRFQQINNFEQRLVASGTLILKFFLHISKEEQLRRFKQWLDDPARRWKISEADYAEREYWNSYEEAFEDALSKCSTNRAPWFVIPSDHKWFRDLAVSHIIVEAMEKLGIELPESTVNLADIRRKYHKTLKEDHAKDKGRRR